MRPYAQGGLCKEVPTCGISRSRYSLNWWGLWPGMLSFLTLKWGRIDGEPLAVADLEGSLSPHAHQPSLVRFTCSQLQLCSGYLAIRYFECRLFSQRLQARPLNSHFLSVHGTKHAGCKVRVFFNGKERCLICGLVFRLPQNKNIEVMGAWGLAFLPGA